MSLDFSYGLQVDGVKIGAIAADGGPGTVLTSPGKVRENTVRLTPAAPTKNQFFAEGESSPAITTAKAGVKNIAFDLLTFDKEVIADLTGGTVTGADENAVYNSPIGSPIIERTVSFTDSQGVQWLFPRVMLTASLVGTFTTTDVNVVRIEGDIMQPTKAGVSDLLYGNPAVV